MMICSIFVYYIIFFHDWCLSIDIHLDVNNTEGGEGYTLKTELHHHRRDLIFNVEENVNITKVHDGDEDMWSSDNYGGICKSVCVCYDNQNDNPRAVKIKFIDGYNNSHNIFYLKYNEVWRIIRGNIFSIAVRDMKFGTFNNETVSIDNNDMSIDINKRYICLHYKFSANYFHNSTCFKCIPNPEYIITKVIQGTIKIFEVDEGQIIKSVKYYYKSSDDLVNWVEIIISNGQFDFQPIFFQYINGFWHFSNINAFNQFYGIVDGASSGATGGGDEDDDDDDDTYNTSDSSSDEDDDIPDLYVSRAND